jgi:hypothetical protein
MMQQCVLVHFGARTRTHTHTHMHTHTNTVITRVRTWEDLGRVVGGDGRFGGQHPLVGTRGSGSYPHGVALHAQGETHTH